VRKFVLEDLLAVAFFLLIFSGGIGLPFVDPPPFKADKPLCVLVLEESKDRGSYSLGQREVMTSQGTGTVRGYVAEKKGELIVWDKDQTPQKDTPGWVAEALKVANRDKLPWIVAASPSSGTSRELPKESAETMAALKKIGGP